MICPRHIKSFLDRIFFHNNFLLLLQLLLYYTVSRKIRHPFYLHDNLIRCHPILLILDKNMPKRIWNDICLYVWLKYTHPTTSRLCPEPHSVIIRLWSGNSQLCIHCTIYLRRLCMTSHLRCASSREASPTWQCYVSDHRPQSPGCCNTQASQYSSTQPSIPLG